MMTAEDRHVTGGVDTHGEVHVAAVLESGTAGGWPWPSSPPTPRAMWRCASG